MTVNVTNSQREAPVDSAGMARLARRAARRLKIRTPGTLSITFITARRMRTLNKRFLRHDWNTDVLSFNYNDARGSGLGARGGIVGEVFVAPAMARVYARAHGIAYEEELARYVVHGLLHWLGHDDKTAGQQKKMRTMENRLLNGHSHH